MCYLAVVPSVALASPPKIGSEWVSEVTEDSAVLEAQIKPEGHEATYEFWLTYAACQSAFGDGSCESIVVKKVGEGEIGANSEIQAVSTDVTSLQPSYSYSFWVVASNSTGTNEGSTVTFTTLASAQAGATGSIGGGAPANFEEEPGIGGGARKEGEEAPRLEAERQAKAAREAKEAAEAQAREVEGREAIEERERRRQSELAEQYLGQVPAAVGCVVPSLKGDSLKTVGDALRKAHCELGKVSRPRGHHARLLVTRQSVRASTRLSSGAAVAVTLGPAKAKRM